MPDADIRALAAEFEAALEALHPFFYRSGSDDDADAATARVDEIVRKIVALPTTDIERVRLKARIFVVRRHGLQNLRCQERGRRLV